MINHKIILHANRYILNEIYTSTEFIIMNSFQALYKEEFINYYGSGNNILKSSNYYA